MYKFQTPVVIPAANKAGKTSGKMGNLFSQSTRYLKSLKSKDKNEICEGLESLKSKIALKGT